MEQDIREIESITFGVYSTKDILNMSVAKIDNTKLLGPGTVYDSCLGTIESGEDCQTCSQDAKLCIGHFGHIELNENIIHPLFYKEVRDFLSCFCVKCYRLLLLEDQILINGFNRFKGRKRFQKILDKIKKVDDCCYCDQLQPEIKYSPTDNTLSLVYKEKVKISIALTVGEIKTVFDNVIDEDIVLLGFDPKLVHPKNFIMEVFPVIPIAARPYVIAEGNYCDDDLTNQILEILKANRHLDRKADPEMSESKRQKYLQSLKFRISTFYNNSNSRAKHTTNGRPIKGLKERLTGKEGQH